MCHKDQGYAEPLATAQCNRFLQISVAEMAENGTYPAAELATTTLLHHMVETQQPAADITSFALVLDGMLLRLNQQQQDVPQQANDLLLSLHSNFLPRLHSQLSTSSATCAVYAGAMAALRRVHEVSAAFQVFLLMAQNKVDGLDQQCCEEVLEVLLADSALWEYTEQHFGETFVELLGSEQTSRDAVVQLPLHRSLPALENLSDSSMQRLVVANGPTPGWMVPVWQGFQPYGVTAQVSHSGMATGSVPESSNEQGSCPADELQPESVSDIAYDLRTLDYNTALQELLAMPKSKVSSIVSSRCGQYDVHVLLHILLMYGTWHLSRRDLAEGLKKMSTHEHVHGFLSAVNDGVVCVPFQRKTCIVVDGNCSVLYAKAADTS